MLLANLKKHYFKLNIFLADRIYRKKYLPISARHRESFFANYSVINNPLILEMIRKVCFTKKDLRAGWFGSGLPKTNRKKYQNYADWATGHLMMYQAFLPSCKTNPRTILDIGSGIGYATLGLADYFPKTEIIGLDYDDEAVSVAKTFNHHPNITYLRDDFFTFKAKKTFDYIFALEVLEHVPASKHDQFIRKCLKLLSSNGLLFISTPNALDEADVLYGHIGLLNRQRAKIFLKKYRSLIHKGFFIDNKNLLTRDPDKFIVKAKLEDFEKKDRNLSHFHLVMRKR